MSSARKTYGGGKAFFRRGSSSQRSFAGSTLFSSVGELHTLQSELQLRSSCLGDDHPATVEVAQAINRLLLAPVRTSTSPCAAEPPVPTSPKPVSTDVAVNEVSCSSDSPPLDVSMDDLGASDEACEMTQECSFASEEGASSHESDVGGDDGDSGDDAPILTKRAAPAAPAVAPAAFPGTNRSYRRQRRKQPESDALPHSMGYVSGIAAAGAGDSSKGAASFSSNSESQQAPAKRAKPRPPSPSVSASALAELEAQRRYFETVDEQELSFEDSEEPSQFSMNLTGSTTGNCSSGMRDTLAAAVLTWPKPTIKFSSPVGTLSMEEPMSRRSRREIALQRASVLFDDEELGKMVECA